MRARLRNATKVMEPVTGVVAVLVVVVVVVVVVAEEVRSLLVRRRKKAEDRGAPSPIIAGRAAQVRGEAKERNWGRKEAVVAVQRQAGVARRQ